jgi:hypothetical protein
MCFLSGDGSPDVTESIAIEMPYLNPGAYRTNAVCSRKNEQRRAVTGIEHIGVAWTQ